MMQGKQSKQWPAGHAAGPREGACVSSQGGPKAGPARARGGAYERCTTDLSPRAPGVAACVQARAPTLTFLSVASCSSGGRLIVLLAVPKQ